MVFSVVKMSRLKCSRDVAVSFKSTDQFFSQMLYIHIFGAYLDHTIDPGLDLCVCVSFSLTLSLDQTHKQTQ